MQIVHWGKARQFYSRYPAAENPLKQWKKAIQKANWANFSDIRETFSTADWVNGKIIFNIKSNQYRVIAIAAFKHEKLYIRQVLSHEEYDQSK